MKKETLLVESSQKEKANYYYIEADFEQSRSI